MTAEEIDQQERSRAASAKLGSGAVTAWYTATRSWSSMSSPFLGREGAVG